MSPRGPGATAIAACLIVTAVIVALTSCAAAVVYALVAMRGDGITVVSILVVAGCAVGGLGLACLLWAAAWLIATRWELLATQKKMLSALTDRRIADAGGVAASVSQTGRSAGEVEHLRRAITELLELKETMLRSPDELSREGSGGPGQPATALLGRFEEADAFALQQRRELYHRIDRCVEGRRWQEAVEAARKLLDTYQGSPEADTVASRIATLEENARIERVRGMRDRIIDLIKRRRYAEAIGLGKEVVEKFPDTKAASDLRAQMPRLVKLAVAKPGEISSETQFLGDILSELARLGDDGDP